MNFNINYTSLFILILIIILFIKISDIIVNKIYAKDEIITLGDKIKNLLNANPALIEEYPYLSSKYLDDVENINYIDTLSNDDFITELANELEKLDKVINTKNNTNIEKELLSLELNLILTLSLKNNNILFYISYKRQLENLNLISREELLYANN